MANDNSSRAGGSKRPRFNFWLDLSKIIDREIAELITTLKDRRLFTQTIRDGIRLICDLKDGNLTVLFEMFPWVRAEFMEYIGELKIVEVEKPSQHPHSQHQSTSQQAQAESPSPQILAERAWLEAEQERIEQERAWEQRRIQEAQKALEAERKAIELERQRIETERQQNHIAMQKQLDRLEQMLLQQGNVPVQSASESRKPSGVGLKGINQGGVGLKGGNSSANFAPPPVFDDDDIPEMTITKSKSGKTAAQNLINGLLGLQQ